MNEPSSPRQGPAQPWEGDIRPIVAVRRSDRPIWWFAGAAVIVGVLLFSALEARRRGVQQASAPPATSFATPESIPDLILPADPGGVTAAESAAGPWESSSSAQQADQRLAAAPPSPAPQPNQAYQPGFAPYEPLVVQPAQAPLLVSGQGEPGGTLAPPDGQAANVADARATGSQRIKAGRLENPATTVVQGTLINAVLETALDSTRPGQTRALVTRDIFGFDGTKLLIPRGTRLYGAYQADVVQGQKRAEIRWTRLLRPDGVTIALDSPAADPLGRAGIKGKVNSHFFQRLGNAVLGTTAYIGSTLATRSIASSSPVIVAVPGATQAPQSIVPQNSNQITPTLTVRQGTRISVFVQHDLDFSSVDEAP